jgi:AraC family transcriptional regulator, regulatory protein of adaptative response / methylated-DNA-[protein]-cysteine methyltransferase
MSDRSEARLDQRRQAIQRVCAMIAEGEETPSLEQMAAVAGLSASRFRRVFKEILGVTPKQYVQGLRRARLQAELGRGGSVTDAIYDAGFGSASRVYERTGELLGMKPSAYRRGGARQSIRYATGECFLGRVLVAATSRGLCAIQLGDGDEELAEALRERFSAADIEHDEDLGEALQLVAAFIEQPSAGLDLPLDVQGTAFQQRVWRALRSIPAGETRSYRQVAELVGAPTAVRAVAGACARNKLAVVVPCHRVVGSDGKLRGYRWGVERKRALLEREAEAEAR